MSRDNKPRIDRENVRVYGSSRTAVKKIMAAKGQTKTEVVRDAIARYEAELIDEGAIEP